MISLLQNKVRRMFGVIFAAQALDRAQVLSVLKNASENGVIDIDSLPIIESVLQIGCLRTKDIMLPRHQVDVIDINDDIQTIARKIIQTGHSRFPVIDGEISNIIGVFHSKDLIRYFVESDKFDLHEHLRQAYFVPEIKRLDALMYEMRVRQTHMAIVVDEFTNIAGIITLEMIVEQIIGEIEDEYDSVDGEREIVELSEGVYRVKGHCKLMQLNTRLGSEWLDDRVETVGGFLIKYLGRVPVVNEILEYDGLRVEVINADSRKVKLCTVSKKIV